MFRVWNDKKRGNNFSQLNEKYELFVFGFISALALVNCAFFMNQNSI